MNLLGQRKLLFFCKLFTKCKIVTLWQIKSDIKTSNIARMSIIFIKKKLGEIEIEF